MGQVAWSSVQAGGHLEGQGPWVCQGKGGGGAGEARARVSAPASHCWKEAPWDTTRVHAHTQPFTHTRTHTLSFTHTDTHTDTHTLSFTHRHRHTRTDTHTVLYTQTHRQTHRLARSLSLCPFLRPLNRKRFDVRISKILSVSSDFLRGSIRNTASLCFRGCLPPSSGGLPVTPSFSGPSARTWRAMLPGELSPHCILRPSQVSHPSLISA